MKYFIISTPKSGTYLCSNVLANLGLHQTWMHFTAKNFYQYFPDRLEQGVMYPEKFLSSLSIEQGINSIPNNGFAVGHIPFNKMYSNLLTDFKKVVLHRDPIDAAESYNRWIKDSGRDRPFRKKIPNDYNNWVTQSNGFDLDFYDMINKKLEKIDQLQIYLFNKIITDSKKLLDQSLQQTSLTKSSLR